MDTMFLLEAVAQTAEQTVERGPATLLIPVALGLLVALAICAFFMRYAAKQGEWDRRHDPNRFKRRK